MNNKTHENTAMQTRLTPIVLGPQRAMRARYDDKLKTTIFVFDETGYVECLFPNGKGGFHIQDVRPSRLKERWGK